MALSEAAIEATITAEFTAALDITEPAELEKFSKAMAAALFTVLKSQVTTLDTNGDTGLVQ